MRPTVLIADDHAMVADGLARLVTEVADLVGQVQDGQHLVDAVRRLRPALVVSDVSMPTLSGIDAMQRVLDEGIETRFILLTVHREPALAAEALRRGASGYLLKDDAGEELLAAMRAVLHGRTYVTPRLTGQVLRRFAGPPDPVAELTSRQRDVLRLLALGKRMKEIAAALDISVRTVEGHKLQVMTRLGADSTADLVRIAIKHGIVDG